VSDLASRLLAAIEEVERLAHEAQDYIGDSPWSVGRARGSGEPYVKGEVAAVCSLVDEASAAHIAHNDPAAVLRRCAADREEVELHHIVWRDIGWLEWDDREHAEMYEELPVCGLCVPKHSSFPTRADVPEGPCQTIRLRARAYGLSVEEETTDE